MTVIKAEVDKSTNFIRKHNYFLRKSTSDIFNLDKLFRDIEFMDQSLYSDF